MNSAPASESVDDAHSRSALAAAPDDMADSPDELDRFPHLRPVLIDLAVVADKYKDADKRARRSQFAQWVLVILAALFGAAAILAALVQLAGYLDPFWEFVFAVAAGVAVLLGIIAACHHKWIRHRFCAEQCRFIKFDYLLHPQRWQGADDHARQAAIQQGLSRLDDAKRRRWLHEWVRREVQVIDDTALGSTELPDQWANELVEYYRTRRLEHQLRYFERQAKNREWWELTWWLPPLLFFASVVVVCAHFVYEIGSGHSAAPLSGAHGGSPTATSMAAEFKGGASDGHAAAASATPVDWNTILVIVAVALPVIGAAVRTFRAANEFGRNANRFHGVANELKALREALARAKGFTDQLRIMEEIETALKNEHRAWVRLMSEAEWFG
jgi:hypothetical protein